MKTSLPVSIKTVVSISNRTIYFYGSAALSCVIMLLVSCTQPYQVSPSESYVKDIPEQFADPYDTDGTMTPGRWWYNFKDDRLTQLIEEAFSNNFTLQQYFARVQQSQALAKKVDSQLYPEVSSELAADKFYRRNRDDTHLTGALLRASWEIDLWNRLSSASKASQLDARASREELEAASLQLSGEIASTYYTIIELNGQYKLVTDQLKTNQKILDILKRRFTFGGSSLLDIYQQQEQLVATRSGIPIISSAITTLHFRLSVLLGRVPGKQGFTTIEVLPQLQQSPPTGVPADLLFNRPDLRRVVNKLHSAGFQIDRAKADRLPRIIIGSDGGFRGSGLTSDDLFLSVFAEIITPVIDWGKREAEVVRSKALYAELSAELNQTFLKAVEEVQSALWQEHELQKLIAIKSEQLQISRAALKESQLRYLQGVIDYLPSLTALFSTQRLEREVISLHRELIQTRISLFQAIGSASYLYGQ